MTDMKEALRWSLHTVWWSNLFRLASDDEFWREFCRARAMLDDRDPDGEDGG